VAKYKTVDTSTLAGQKRAERLKANGWTITRSGLFLIYFEKRPTIRRRRRLERVSK
jgi:hypothetical protein